MEIISVRDRRIKALVENHELTSVKGFDQREVRIIVEQIAAIRVMTHPLQLLAVPSWRAHELIPGQPGKWALRVTPNWRLTFHVDLNEQEVRLLDYEDYH
jgi:proteic killer suppression protein